MQVLTQHEFQIIDATEQHLHLAKQVVKLIEEASKTPGTGIALRTEEYIAEKIKQGKAVIALHNGDNDMAGFCYIETWENKKYVANSGLVVSPKYRKSGLASEIKKRAFELSRKKYPNSKIFGLTTSLAVMKINTALGYVPVTFSEITQDDEFWQGCQTCNYYDILVRTKRDKCLCTGMLFDPKRRTTVL
ncbi:MAG: GNAT family N-acetyltransferase [Bacteroidales bacterium]|nr:GNAT family N-acetyltransferase [Bacteroidales bacterium]